MIDPNVARKKLWYVSSMKQWKLLVSWDLKLISSSKSIVSTLSHWVSDLDTEKFTGSFHIHVNVVKQFYIVHQVKI